MLRELDVPEHKELALLGFKLASLVFKRKSQDNLDWLIARDLLRDPGLQVSQEISFY